MLMGKTCKMCTIPNIIVIVIHKLYLPWNIHYLACSCQKLGTGVKLQNKGFDMKMSISADTLMFTLNLFMLNVL